MIKDLVGKIFGRLKVLKFSKILKKKSYWECKCSCGKRVEKLGHNLTQGFTKSCGCLNIEKCKEYEDISGQKFNYLTVIERDFSKNDKILWKCLCDCGNYIISLPHDLRRGKTKSCGCLRKKLAGERTSKRNSIYKGKKSYNYRHDISERERILLYDRFSDPKFRRWRRKVLKRDNNTCQICLGEGNVTHHIYSWNSHKKLRYVVSNGITLCQKCHIEFHVNYGYGNNTRKQFNDFKEHKK